MLLLTALARKLGALETCIPCFGTLTLTSPSTIIDMEYYISNAAVGRLCSEVIASAFLVQLYPKLFIMGFNPHRSFPQGPFPSPYILLMQLGFTGPECKWLLPARFDW
uniref:Uncharacterized protein n=1 Tax=Branchiostoma floridae TaxID=7739 RepID=C3Z616_BRAFL|eukprot:XP_002596267.1 hypothetical protein BRAFLDRAFT_65980 [Branchiostoma floridae]